jgi:hypothetical protein
MITRGKAGAGPRQVFITVAPFRSAELEVLHAITRGTSNPMLPIPTKALTPDSGRAVAPFGRVWAYSMHLALAMNGHKARGRGLLCRFAADDCLAPGFSVLVQIETNWTGKSIVFPPHLTAKETLRIRSEVDCIDIV